MSDSGKLDVIYDMVKEIDRKQDDMRESQIRMEEDVNYHIRRTDLLEEKMNLQKKATNERFKKLEEPKQVISGIKKALIWLGGIGTAVFGIYKGYETFKHLF